MQRTHVRFRRWGHPAARGEHPAGCLEDVFGLHALSLRHLFTRVSQHMTVPACFEKCCGGGDHEQLEKNTLMCRPCDTPLKSDGLTKPSWSFTGMEAWRTRVLRVFARGEVRTLGFSFPRDFMVPLLPHSLWRASTSVSTRCRMESHVAWLHPVGLGLPHTWFARKTVLAVLRVRGQTMIRAGVGDTETRGQQRVRRQLEHAILF